MRLRSIGMGYFLGAPDVISLLNMAFGFLAILMAMDNQLALSSVCVLAAIVFDSIDGWVARKTNRVDSLGFGKNIDSLADAVSFGVAPAIIFYSISSSISSWVSYVGVIISLFMLVCGILRLTRYNVIADKINYNGFIGFPIPGMAMILVTYYLSGLFNVYVAIILMLLVSYLMISTIRYPKYDNIYGIGLGGLMILLLLLPFDIMLFGVNLPALILFVLSLVYLFITFLEFFIGGDIADSTVNKAKFMGNKVNKVGKKVNDSISDNIEKVSQFDDK